MSRLDTAANVTMVLVGLAVIGEIGYRHIASDASGASLSRSRTSEGAIRVGDEFSMPGLSLARDAASLVLVVSSRCRFCQESVPFYETLSLSARSRRIRTVGVCVDNERGCRDLFEAGHVELDALVSAPPGSLRIAGTPTLIVLDRSHRVRGVWKGRVSEAEQRNLLGFLSGS